MDGTIRKRLAKGRGLLAALVALLAVALLAVGMAAPTRASASTFPDVPQGTWYATWVDQASEKGLMTGYGPGSRQGQFGPGDAITRAQVATVLWRMADSPEPAGAAGFPDVEQGSWYADAVAWCAEQGVVTGYDSGPDEGKFVPDGEITRQELAAMSWRWAKWAKVDVACPDPAAFESTTDWRSVSDFAVEAMTWTAAAGVLTGVDNHDGTLTLDPSGTATRAMAAKIFVVLSGKPVAPKASHTVTFEANGGSAVASQSVTCGETATEPDAPEKLDRAFAGWFADAALKTPFDFNTPVTSDITLYAKWDEAQAYAVLYSDGLLSLQLGDDVDASRGTVLGTWKWDRTSSPWAATYRDKVKSVVARDRISLSGDCTGMFSYLTDSVTETSGLRNCVSMDLKKLDVSGVTSFAEMFADCSALKTLDVSGWKTSCATDFHKAFSGCLSLESLDLSGWDVSSATSLSEMFRGCSTLASLDVSGWDVSKVTDFSDMFRNCPVLTALDLSDWNVSSATDLSGMFLNCLALTSLDLTGWNPSSAANLSNMFHTCSSLTSLDLSDWDVSSVTSFSGAFFGCLALTQLDVSTWDVSHATDLSWVFTNCTSLKSLDLSGWKPSSVKALSYMFDACSSLESLNLSGWNVSGVTGFRAMFADCSSLASIDLSGWSMSSDARVSGMFRDCDALLEATLGEGCGKAAEQLGGPWYKKGGDAAYDAIPAEALPGTFVKGRTVTFNSNGGTEVASLTVLNGGTVAAPAAPEKLDCTFAGWYSDEALEQPYDFATTPVTKNITLYAKWDEAQAYAVLYSDGLLSLQLGADEDTTAHGAVLGKWEWDSASNPWADMTDMATSVVARDRISLSGDCSELFAGLVNCESMSLGKLDTSGVISFEGMFRHGSSLESLDLSSWDVSRAQDFSGMFEGCSKLESLDLSSWDVSSADDFSCMFSCCSSLKDLDLSDWDVSSATNLYGMLGDCSKLGSLDLSGWDVSKVQFLFGMFEGDSALTTLNLSGWDVSSVIDLGFMFSGCSSLVSLNLSGWDPSSAEYLYDMFSGCSKLGSLNLSGWNVPEGAGVAGMFSGCDSLVEVTLGKGCALLVGQLGSPWCEGDAAYDAIPTDALPGTFVKGRTVTFNSNGGSDIASLTVPNGGTAAAPDAPTKEGGYTFVGWYSDEGLTQEYDFSVPVTSNIILYAKWAQPYAVLYSDGLLSLQLGDDVDTTAHGAVLGKWEWDRTSRPWAETYRDMVTSVVVRDRISLSGDCSGMFSYLKNCESMNLGKLDVSGVTDLSWMFYACSKLESLDLSGWGVSKATSLSFMFSYDSALTTLDLSGWDVSSATDLSSMFSACSKLESLNLSGWNPSSATELSYMFYNCGSLIEVTLGEDCAPLAEQLGGPWCKGDAAYDAIPTDALPGTFIKGRTVTFNSNGGSDVASQVVANGATVSKPDAPEMLDHLIAGWCSDEALGQLYDFESTPVTKDITLYAKWDEAQAYAVLYADGLLSLQLGDDEDTETHGSVEGMWEWARTTRPWADMAGSVKSVVVRDRISLSGNCLGMFKDLVNCESMNLGKLDVSGVTGLSWMFYDCSSLESLDLSGWDTSSATDLYGMFSDCSKLESLDLSRWDVSKVTRLTHMFFHDSALTTLNLSGWDVSSVEYLTGMFSNCPKLESLNLSGWSLSSAQYLSDMFYNCDALSTVTLGKGCGRIVDQLGGPWYDADGNVYSTIPAGVAGTFTKTKPAAQADQDAQALESLDGTATFDDVVLPDAVAGEEGGLIFEEVEGSPEPGGDADSDASADADQDVDNGIPSTDVSNSAGGSDVSDASDPGETFDASDASDVSDASDATVDADQVVDAASFADTDQASASDAPADGVDVSADSTAEQADAPVGSEVADFAGEEVSDLAA